MWNYIITKVTCGHLQGNWAKMHNGNFMKNLKVTVEKKIRQYFQFQRLKISQSLQEPNFVLEIIKNVHGEDGNCSDNSFPLF